MSKPDPYAGIDFDELNDATGLESDEIKCLKTCFDLFDSKKQDFLSADDLDEILRAMGFRYFTKVSLVSETHGIMTCLR